MTTEESKSSRYGLMRQEIIRAAVKLFMRNSVSSVTLSQVAQAPSNGFETAISAPSAAPVFAVQALGGGGEVLALSHAVSR